MVFSPQFIAASAQGVVLGHSIQLACEIVVDSRAVRKDYCFFALSGERQDGHAFLKEVIDSGACGLVIQSDRLSWYNDLSEEDRQRVWCVVVANTYDALGACAHAWRLRFSIPCIGVTGTVGKTTTKEFIGAILQHAGHCALVTQKSMNGLVGLPLTLLGLRDHHTIAVCEVGISQKGEMDRLANLLKPDVAVITCIGRCHLQGLGSVHNVAIEKKKLFSALQHTAIINGDQVLLTNTSYQHPVITFGKKNTNDIQATKIKFSHDLLQFTLRLYQRTYRIALKTMHTGVLYNMLAAAAAVQPFAVDDECILAMMRDVPCVPGRFQLLKCNTHGSLVINDAYNANPESMKSGVEAFDRMQYAQPKVLVLGDMLELGPTSATLHKSLVRLILRTQTIEEVICVGDQMRSVQNALPYAMKTVWVPTYEHATEYVDNALNRGCAIMLKASLGMKFGLILEKLAEKHVFVPR